MVGRDLYDKLVEYHKNKRAPYIAKLGDLKPYKIKLEEFLKRGQESKSAADSLNKSAEQLEKELTVEIAKLSQDLLEKGGTLVNHHQDAVTKLQPFIVACNLNKNKVDAPTLDQAERYQQAFTIHLRNDKTYLKTWVTTLSNIVIKCKGPLAPPELKSKTDELQKKLVTLTEAVGKLKFQFDAFETKLKDAKAAK